MSDVLLGLRPLDLRVGRLWLAIDPRLELMAVVQSVSSYGEHWPLLSRLDFTYRRDVAAHFAPFRDHPAVTFLDGWLARPFSEAAPPFAFSGPPELALCLTAEGGLDPAAYDRDLLMRRAGDAATLDGFVARLHSFFLDTDFAAFYRAHATVLGRAVEATAAKVVLGDVEMLERFYGMRKRSYTVLLAPLYGTVGYGLETGEAGTEAAAIYNVMGPNGVADDLPVFGSRDYFRMMVRHEFSHPYVNPLTDRHWDLAAAHDRYAEIAEAMRGASYGEWRDAVNEHVIRAVTTWFAYQDGEAEGEAALQRELDRGFVFVPVLLDRLRVYAAHRDRYPTFAAFYPELLTAFDEQETA